MEIKEIVVISGKGEQEKLQLHLHLFPIFKMLL